MKSENENQICLKASILQFFLEAPLDSFSGRGLSKMSFIKAEVRNKLDDILTSER